MLLSVFLCIFFSKSLLFLCLTVEYLILEHLETATISQLTFDMQISIVFWDMSVLFLWTCSSCLLNPVLLLCPVLDPAHYRKQPAEGAAGLLFKGNCWLAVFSTLKKKYMEIIFLQSEQSEWEDRLKFVKVVSSCLLPSHLPQSINKTGQFVSLIHLWSPLLTHTLRMSAGQPMWLSNFSINSRCLCEHSIHREPKEGENKNLFTLSLSN